MAGPSTSGRLGNQSAGEPKGPKRRRTLERLGKLLPSLSVEFGLGGGALSLESSKEPAPRLPPPPLAGSTAAQLAALAPEQRASLKALMERIEADRDGATLAALLAGGEVVDDAFCLRWLRGRAQWDLEEAVSAARSHAAWKSANYPHGAVPKEEIAGELAAQKVYLQGLNDEHRPLVVVAARKHRQGRPAETHRLICYTLDVAGAVADAHPGSDGRVLAIIDLTGLRLRNLDVGALRYIFDTLRHHYPDRLGKMVFLNAPGIFLAVWRCLAPNLGEVTRSRIAFASTNESKASGSGGVGSVAALFAPDHLPKQYGGGAEWITIDQAADALARDGGLAAGTNAAPSDGAPSTGAAKIRSRLHWVRQHVSLRRPWKRRSGDGAPRQPLLKLRRALSRFLLPGVWTAFFRGVAGVVRWAGTLPRLMLGIEGERLRATRCEKLRAHKLD